jgi:hypothetical protein
VLDSVSATGGDSGNISDQQFRWIHRQLTEADDAGEVVIAFAHHTLRTIVQGASTVFARPAPGEPPVHFGIDGDPTGACPSWDPVAPTLPNETLRCLSCAIRAWSPSSTAVSTATWSSRCPSPRRTSRAAPGRSRRPPISTGPSNLGCST